MRGRKLERFGIHFKRWYIELALRNTMWGEGKAKKESRHGSKNGEDGTGRWWDVDQLFHFGHVKLRYLLDATVVVLKQMNDML